MATSKVTFNGTTLIDITDTTATADKILSGYTAYGSDGVKITGTASGGGGATLQTKSVSYTPSETAQSDTVSPDTGYDGLSSVSVSVGGIATDYVGSGITRRSGTDVVASYTEGLENYITVPSGYYPQNLTLYNKYTNLPDEGQYAFTVDDYGINGYNKLMFFIVPIASGMVYEETSYTMGTDIDGRSSSDLTASGATVTVPSGYYSSQATKSVGSGSATTPATTITANPSISVNASGLITATASASQSVTPTVSAGYVSSGTAGTITVSGSNTQQLTTQSAQTIYPSTTDQTIASGRYLTGTQTIKAVTVSGLSASNIASGVTVKVGDSADDDRITSVTGTLSFVTYYTGSSAPSSSTGSDGDIYLQTS